MDADISMLLERLILDKIMLSICFGVAQSCLLRICLMNASKALPSCWDAANFMLLMCLME
jgi:hypothetical protein